jgi:hypothetical protein
MAIKSVHRNDKEAREFFQRVVGRGGFVPYKPPQKPEEPISSGETKAEPTGNRSQVLHQGEQEVTTKGG